jgi:hypothetical protein
MAKVRQTAQSAAVGPVQAVLVAHWVLHGWQVSPLAGG